MTETEKLLFSKFKVQAYQRGQLDGKTLEMHVIDGHLFGHDRENGCIYILSEPEAEPVEGAK